MLTAIINFKYSDVRITYVNFDEVNKIISISVYDQQQMDEVAELSKQIDLQNVPIFTQYPICVPDGMLVFGRIHDPQQRGKNITTTEVLTQKSGLEKSTGRRYFGDYGMNEHTAFDYSDYEDKIFELAIYHPIIVKFKKTMNIPALKIRRWMAVEDTKYYLDNINTNILRFEHDANWQGLEFYRGDTLIIMNYDPSIEKSLDIVFANKNIKHLIITSRYPGNTYLGNIEDCDLLSFYPHNNEIANKVAENIANLTNSRFKKMKPIMS